MAKYPIQKTQTVEIADAEIISVKWNVTDAQVRLIADYIIGKVARLGGKKVSVSTDEIAAHFGIKESFVRSAANEITKNRTKYLGNSVSCINIIID